MNFFDKSGTPINAEKLKPKLLKSEILSNMKAKIGSALKV
jgi:hypothetical protein